MSLANKKENKFNNKSLEFDIYDGLLSFANGEENIQSLDFMMDFNMGVLCFYKLLVSSYLSKSSCVFKCSNDYDNGLSPSSKKYLIFSNRCLARFGERSNWTMKAAGLERGKSSWPRERGRSIGHAWELLGI